MLVAIWNDSNSVRTSRNASIVSQSAGQIPSCSVMAMRDLLVILKIWEIRSLGHVGCASAGAIYVVLAITDKTAHRLGNLRVRSRLTKTTKILFAPFVCKEI